MVDEKEESYEAQEEGEYHFSDDQVNYELEPESAKAAPAATVGKENIFAKFGQSRRMLLGVVAFFFLIFIVYKMLTSSSTTPPSEFSPETTAKPITSSTPPKPIKPLVPEAPSTPPSQPPVQTPVTAVQTPSPLPPQPSAQQSQAQAQTVQVQPTQIQQPVTPSPMPSQTEQVQTTPTPPSQQVVQTIPSAAPAQLAPPMPETSPSLPPTTNVEMNDAQSKMIMDRLAALEEQNAKLMSLVQTQFAQRMSESQMQNMATQQKVHTLSKRLSNMEGSINKIAQIMQDEGFSKAMPLTVGNAGLPSARGPQSKIVYTVQAIIPGRAWLKSDAGDTVTVAEGDLLKDYGKVIKIDPYDGVVEIDTGTKTISLSYGVGGD